MEGREFGGLFENSTHNKEDCCFSPQYIWGLLRAILPASTLAFPLPANLCNFRCPWQREVDGTVGVTPMGHHRAVTGAF